MKAVAYRQPLPIDHADALVDTTLPDPVAAGRDLLVEVRAVSVNPVDVKVRASAAPPEGQWKTLGWDATGVVRAVGERVTGFRPGDRVWYAGAIDRAGSNAELQLVDERIASRMPESLGFAEAAALPLTAITAWELLFERLRLAPGKSGGGHESLLVVGGAGGVGSILVQLALRLTHVNVIATASRPDTVQWLRDLGVRHVIDHHKPFAEELQRIGFPQVKYVVGLTHTDAHFDQIVQVLEPQGHFALIDDPKPFDPTKMKRKSLSLHWELMFTRSLFQTPDMSAQGRLLDEVARLVDTGVLRSTVNAHFGAINAANLRRAHALLESGKSIGKIVLEGF